MAKFRVLRRVDAWIDYIVEIDADNPDEAARAAHRCPALFAWVRAGEEEFPNTLFVALDEQGCELAQTQRMSG